MPLLGCAATAGMDGAAALETSSPSHSEKEEGFLSTGRLPCPPSRIEPVAPQRVRFSFTGDEELLRKLERARQILKHKHPAGKLEDIFAEALDLLLEKKILSAG